MTIFAPQQARSERTLVKILDACDDLLASRTLEQISMQDIAGQAGISVGNLYNRFENKQALIDHVISRHQATFAANMAARIEAQPADLTLAAKLEILVREFASGLADLRPVFVTLIVRRSRDNPAVSSSQVNSGQARKTDEITEMLARWLMACEDDIAGKDKLNQCRFAVASIAFNLQFDVLLETPSRMFGDSWQGLLRSQAFSFLTSEGGTP
jgi:AcrR family transcriptional regulator